MPDAGQQAVICARRLGELCAHLQDQAETEKAALAHRLHDGLGGLLTAAKMDLSWLQSRVAEPGLQQRLTQLGTALDEAMNLKRRVVDELRPSLLDHFGLSAAMRAHAQAACAAAGITCELALEDDVESMPKRTAIALFRVMQGGLENVLHHAQAKVVRLELSRTPELYVLSLADDGRGMAPAQGSACGFGLAAMQQRMQTLGGSFSIDSLPGGGTTLTASIPNPGPPSGA